MRDVTATEVVTAKCEGCGVRLAPDKLWRPYYPSGAFTVSAWTVCSLACYRHALAADQARSLAQTRQARGLPPEGGRPRMSDDPTGDTRQP